MIKEKIIQIIIILCAISLFSTSPANLVVQQESWRVDMEGGDPSSEWISTENGHHLSNSHFPEITWSSRDNPNDSIIETDAIIAGDHAIIKADMESEYLSIIKIEMMLHGRSPLNRTQSLVYNHHAAPMSQNDFDWLIVENITKGLMVNLEVNFSNTNCDIYAWWNDELDTGDLDLSADLLGNQLATFSKPENGSFIPNRSGDLAIGCFNFSNSTGIWSILLNQTTFNFGTEKCSIEIDTYSLGRNVECGMNVTGYASNGSEVRRNYTNLSITNFFAPEIENKSIEEIEIDILRVSWDIYDRNADDNHFYEIFFSRDYGDSWMLLAKDLNESLFEWDTTPFLTRDEYRLRIRAYDNDCVINPNANTIEECWPGLMSQSFIIIENFTTSHVKTSTQTSFTTATLSSNTNYSNSPTQIANTLWWFILPGSLVIILVLSLLFISRRHRFSY
jgi:hypothetical protein